MYTVAGLARVLAVVVMLAGAGLAALDVARANWPETWAQAGERAMVCARAQAAARGITDPLQAVLAQTRAQRVCDSAVDQRATDSLVVAQGAGVVVLGLALLLGAVAVRRTHELGERIDDALARAAAPRASRPASAAALDASVQAIEREVSDKVLRAWREPGPHASAAEREARQRGEG
jgi:hypothetical protein